MRKELFIRFFVLLSVVGTLIASCRPLPQYPVVLHEADSLTMTNPDSAIKLLQGIAPQMEQASLPARRYYQLLNIKAQDKAYIPHTSDSLILSLLHYYTEEGDPRLLPEVCYYAGRVTRDLGDAPQALNYFHQALDAMEQTDYKSAMKGKERTSIKLQGRIYSQMGGLFRHQHLNDEAIKFFECAYSVDSINGDTVGMICNLTCLGGLHRKNKDYSVALLFFDKAENLGICRRDSSALFDISLQKAVVLSDINKIEEAIESINKYLTPATNLETKTTQAGLALIYSKCGNLNVAEENIRKLLHSDDLQARSNANLWLAYRANGMDDSDSALLYLREYMELEDAVNKQKNEEAIALSQSLYNYQLREKEILSLKIDRATLRAQSWMYFAISVIAFFFLYVEFTRRYKIKKSYDQLQNVVASRERHHELKLQLATIVMADLKKSETYKNICQKRDENTPLTISDWKKIEKLYDYITPEFLPLLRGIYSFNDTEWKISLLMKMDFSLPEIAALTSHSYEAVYSSQSRLFKKVFKKDVSYKNWKEFILLL